MFCKLQGRRVAIAHPLWSQRHGGRFPNPLSLPRAEVDAGLCTACPFRARRWGVHGSVNEIRSECPFQEFQRLSLERRSSFSPKRVLWSEPLSAGPPGRADISSVTAHEEPEALPLSAGGSAISKDGG